MAVLKNKEKETKVFQFSDAAGADTVDFKDIDGFVKARFDSKGNLFLRGAIKKL